MCDSIQVVMGVGCKAPIMWHVAPDIQKTRVGHHRAMTDCDD